MGGLSLYSGRSLETNNNIADGMYWIGMVIINFSLQFGFDWNRMKFVLVRLVAVKGAYYGYNNIFYLLVGYAVCF